MGINAIKKKLWEPVAIYPLAGFRVLFGAAMVLSTLRFILLGWVEDHYLEPLMHFHYFGFSWIEPGPAWWMYGAHVLLILASLGVMFGWYYRLSAALQFVLFTYTELIDLTYYLNHYYYVSLISFLLLFLPANRHFSLDVRWRKLEAYSQVPRWMPGSLMAMMAIVYTYAGLAKINYDWLIEAQPLQIWLPASNDVPVLGALFGWHYAPWLFSWAGMIYDCSIAFLLWNKRTRVWAYLSVILFHTLTGILFQI
ncbi:MAG: HTTM domain-containing protein [Bacteroidota bacterium]|nr:HTTM domain-containing protein [Bacteroidota bacterium]MDX5430336.1 HTTM domain-containing protein [Bacteroidota bacterium]MDX5469097.1 HTTM domain-containing protein [Bacteroidota bacterium]